MSPDLALGFFLGVCATGFVFAVFWLLSRPKPPPSNPSPTRLRDRN